MIQRHAEFAPKADNQSIGRAESRRDLNDRSPCRSVIIPVFNGAKTIAHVVEEVVRECAGRSLEIVLVNDGSSDDSELVCRSIVARHAGRVILVQLSRNSGEQRAVLTGLRYCRGDHAAVIDDDGQQPAADVARLFHAAERGEHDVIFGRYAQSRHSWHRRLVSRLHNAAAVRLFGKPTGLYLSSFKVVNRYTIDRLTEATAPFVNIDAMVLQITNRFAQVDVEHRERRVGRSGYTYRKLFAVWFEALLGFSLLPFRIAMVVGIAAAVAALAGATAPSFAAGWFGASPMIVLLLGIILFYLGVLGECVVRWSNASDAAASSIVRYVINGPRP